MRFFVDYPLLSSRDRTWVDPAAMTEFAQVAEASGVDAIALTDHPAPSRKWLNAGGHETLDPFPALAFFAAATSTLRVMTHLTVVPYRNPLLLAKSMTAVDVLSGGRATFALGTGYLRSEFASLGVEFEARNALFDESIEVMKGLWASPDEFHHQGPHFKALGATLEPGPVQKPHPPLWLGGNSRLVRDRVAAWGDGWAPMTGGSAELMRTSRTPAIASEEDLVGHLDAIREAMAAHGRDPAVLDVAAGGFAPLSANPTVDEQVDRYGRMAELGVTWTGVSVARSSVPAALDSLRAFAEVATQAR